MTIDAARRYVGTTPKSGVAQFAILGMEGLTPPARVLEYGCGSLHLARVLVPFLWPDHYCAIEPNSWLIDAARNDDLRLDAAIRERGARFRHRDDFDAASFDVEFDYVFAHSVLSHAAWWQLAQFLDAASSVLAVDGKIICSYREGRVDTDAAEWTYPDATFFSWPTVSDAAAAAGLTVRSAPDLRSFYVAACPDEVHDWLVFEMAR